MRRIISTLLLPAVAMMAFSSSLTAVPLGGKEKAPRGLEYVPGDAMFFVHLNLGDLQNSPHFKLLRTAPAKNVPAFLPDFTLDEYGIPLENVVGLTTVIKMRGEMTIIVTKKPFDQKTVLRSTLEKYNGKSVEVRHGGHTIHVRSYAFERGGKVPVNPDNNPGEAPGFRDAPPPPPPPPGECGQFPPQPPQVGGAPGGRPLDLYARTVWFLNPRTAIIGRAKSVMDMIDQQGKEARPGPMTAALKQVTSTKHHLSMGANVPMEARQQLERELKQSARRNPFMAATIYNIKPLMDATSASLTASVGDVTTVQLRGEFPSATQAKRAQDSVRFGLQLFRGILGYARESLENEIGLELDPASKSEAAQLWNQLDQALAKATIKQDGKALIAEAKAGTEIKLVRTAVANALPVLQRRAFEVQSMNNLKQIGIALHSIHDAHRRFPLPAWQGAIQRRPVKGAGLSWRVAILPYIEQQNLYQQFKLDEPWDSEHNKKLIPLMPKTLAAPGTDSKKGLTFYRVFTGRMAMFDPMQAKSFAHITDGTSNTIMVIEAGEPVIWTKPDELEYDPKKPLPKLGGIFPKKMHVLFGDGSVRSFKKGLGERLMRAYITANGGEVVPYNPGDEDRPVDQDFPRPGPPQTGEERGEAATPPGLPAPPIPRKGPPIPRPEPKPRGN